MPSETPSALDDVRVLDLAGEMGQYCTKLLADLGADVIKVEPPSGDSARNVPPFHHDEPGPQRSLYWLNLNTSKRGVTLDVEKEEGRELFRRLVATADVVVETFEPGYLDGLGLGYEGLSKIKPDIVVTSITGFGQTGPHAHYKAPDIVGVAMGGTMWLAGDPQDPPNVPPWRQGYISAGIIGATGTMTALLHRDLHGEGQHVDVSMQEALSIAQETAMQSWDMLEQLRNRTGSRGMIPLDVPGIGIYECTDGHVFGYVGTPGGATWPELLGWMEEEEMEEDLTEEPYKTFIDNLNLRFLTGLMEDPASLGEKIRIMSHIMEVLRKFIATKSKWEVYEGAQGRRLLFGIVSTPETPVEHPELGDTLRYPGGPYRLTETTWAIRRKPPEVGEHNSEIYGEVGVTEEDLKQLKSAGAI
jgi:crotonobetainyl-CoA:carnitine CoA-transferase CaiB-like acyl-CoA transferase